MNDSELRDNDSSTEQTNDVDTVNQPPLPSVSNDQTGQTTESETDSTGLVQLTVDGPYQEIYLAMRDTSSRYPSDIDISWPSILETEIREEWLQEVANLVGINATEATVHDFVSAIIQLGDNLQAEKEQRKQEEKQQYVDEVRRQAEAGIQNFVEEQVPKVNMKLLNESNI